MNETISIIRHLLDSSKEGQIEIIQSLLDLKGLDASDVQKVEMLAEIKRVVATHHIDHFIQNRNAMNDILRGRFVRRINNNAELLDNRADATTAKATEAVVMEEAIQQVSFIDALDTSKLFTEIEKQVLISREDRAYVAELTQNKNNVNDRPDLLSGLNDRAKWEIFEVASAKMRLLRAFKVPLTPLKD